MLYSRAFREKRPQKGFRNKMAGIFQKQKETSEGKYPIVLRRDGTVLESPFFVMTLKDPCTAKALAAYADEAEKIGLDKKYVSDIRELAKDATRAHRADKEQESGPTADPDAPRHRKDDPVVINWARAIKKGKNVNLRDIMSL